MALTVTFTGRTSLPTPVPATLAAYKIWSYRIQATGPGELPVGRRIALGLPGDVEVLSPSLYPNVPQLAGTFVERDLSMTRQYVGRLIAAAGPQTVSFVAYESETTREAFLVRAEPGQPWAFLPYTIGELGGTPNHAQVLAAPAALPSVSNGRPLTEFGGTLPYASEVFGVYQPLAGWFGAMNTVRAAAGIPGYELSRLDRQTFSGDAARTLSDEALAALAERFEAAAQDRLYTGVLSPVGVADLFRQYFFEFDTFLGTPAGHLWISPGGTVEVVETSTRRTLVEKVAEQAEETSRKIEESLTEQDDVADAVKEDNANETKLGVSLSGGVSAGVYHADASASFSTTNTVKRSSEETHKHSRTQSAKVTSEIKRNYKTTFKTVTETTDTSSRRYVVQNTTEELVNYELRRKMRKVGVQLQHIGTRLSWQLYLPDPGRELGLGDLVHVVPAPDLTAIKKYEERPLPEDKQVPFHDAVPFILTHGDDTDAEETYKTTAEHGPDVGVSRDPAPFEEDNLIKFRFDYPLPPPPAGYKLRELPNPPGAIAQQPDFHGAQVQYTTTHPDLAPNPDPATRRFSLRLTHANFGGRKSLPFDAAFIYEPTEGLIQTIKDQNNKDKEDYEEQVAQLQREAYGEAVRDRLRLVSSMRPRPPENLRSEERQTVYGNLIHKLLKLFADEHLGSELIRQIFDVDEMLYFVAPDFWRPRPTVEPPPITKDSVGRYPVPKPPWEPADQPGLLAGETVAGWYSYTDSYKPSDPPDPPDPLAYEWRVNYLITEQTLPAPLGSSLGWLIQIDGDERRNQFLNAAWAKAVLPVRPGHELDALEWIKKVEGEAALGLDYPVQPNDPEAFKVPNPDGTKKTVGQVLQLVATDLKNSNTTENLLATEKVFETGFDPLEGGFRPAAPYQVFDQWIEVLPTDQIAAVQVAYDPITGQQIPYVPPPDPGTNP